MNKPYHIHICGPLHDVKLEDSPPSGYLEWHEWARLQHKAGRRQKRCAGCGKYMFELEGIVHRCRTSTIEAQP